MINMKKSIKTKTLVTNKKMNKLELSHIFNVINFDEIYF